MGSSIPGHVGSLHSRHKSPAGPGDCTQAKNATGMLAGSPCDGEKLGVGEGAAGRGDVVADIIKVAQIEVPMRIEDVAACAVDS